MLELKFIKNTTLREPPWLGRKNGRGHGDVFIKLSKVSYVRDKNP